ncbi:hypothetical protein ILUMI_26231 [Ignelater luminosus]|uniref:Phosphatidylinositol N-acetylglucosaminyltransferase subunit H conserved domain-containing protein n=1 Tax=Ignelater luminosus TaxID=2038154 RepID=A0A8K0FZ56_IGNLU|nr:hypothetical protein ILUMI_26231 [Ignelater luminosus]
MCSNAKCVYYNQSRNLSGNSILLKITEHDNKALEIIVNYVTENSLHRKWILLLLVIFLNVYSLMYEILSTNYCVVIYVIVLFIIYNIVFTVRQERVLIVEPVGYQIEVHYVFGKSTNFIAWENIKSVFINEVVSKQRVIFIITILTKDTAKDASAIIPLFTRTMPRLTCLEAIYQHIQHCHS